MLFCRQTCPTIRNRILMVFTGSELYHVTVTAWQSAKMLSYTSIAQTKPGWCATLSLGFSVASMLKQLATNIDLPAFYFSIESGLQ
jgi:hypothetical protein